MKTRNLFVLLLLFTGLLSSCSKTKIQSYFSDAAIQIDGSAADWEKVPLFFNEKPAFVFGAVNDTSRLDLMIRFNDPALAQMMYRRGFVLWFDDDEKFGLNFNGRNMPGISQNRRRQNPDSLRKRSFGNKRIPLSLSLQDFDVILKGSVRNINQSDVLYLNAASGVEEGLYCFEFSVPLVPESEKGYGALISKKNEVNVIFKIKEMKRNIRESNASAMSMRGGGGGMSGGRRGGGRRGGGMKGGGMSRPDLSAIEFKAVVQLSFP